MILAEMYDRKSVQHVVNFCASCTFIYGISVLIIRPTKKPMRSVFVRLLIRLIIILLIKSHYVYSRAPFPNSNRGLFRLSRCKEKAKRCIQFGLSTRPVEAKVEGEKRKKRKGKERQHQLQHPHIRRNDQHSIRPTHIE